MPKADKFERLAPSYKRLMDTVRLIAYRAEFTTQLAAAEGRLRLVAISLLSASGY